VVLVASAQVRFWAGVQSDGWVAQFSEPATTADRENVVILLGHPEELADTSGGAL